VRGSQSWRRWLHRLTTQQGRRSGHLVGTDLRSPRNGSRRRPLAITPLIVLALGALLTLTALRNDIMRMQYELTESGRQERKLLDLQSLLTVRHRQLMAPGRLKAIARERGFVRPDRVIELTEDEQLRPVIELASGEALLQ
jgi:hypothetical protein